jgi:hypothetical protein
LLSGFGPQNSREMTGIFAAHLGGIVADAFDQEPAAGHLTMFARRRRASLGYNGGFIKLTGKDLVAWLEYKGCPLDSPDGPAVVRRSSDGSFYLNVPQLTLVTVPAPPEFPFVHVPGLPGAVQYQLFSPGVASVWKYDSPAPLH